MELRIKCVHCAGSGTAISGEIPGVNATCPFCHGSGDEALIRLPNGYYYSVDIMNCINLTEFQQLNADGENAVMLIVSAGQVNMNVGSNARAKLFSLFPAGKTTNSALLALIGQ